MTNEKLTYEELENQIAELKKQNEFLRLNTVFQDEEKGKRAAELIIANKELDFQNEEKRKRIAKLIIAEHKIEESDEKYRISEIDLKKAQSVARLGNWKWDLKTSEIIWSDEMFQIFGIDKNSYKGRLGDVITNVIYPDDLYLVLPSNASEFAEKKPIEYRIILSDKSIRYIWAEAGETILDDKGKPLFLRGIAQDITERKLMEINLKSAKEKVEDNERNLLTINEEYETINEELRQTNEKLLFAKEKAEESDHLKTAFLLNMSHEIKTPMNAINGFSNMLNKPELSDEKRKSFTSIIINSSNQLQSIINNILTISALETKLEKTTIQPVCINNIVVELLAIFKTQAFNQNISLYAKQELTDKQSEIYTDKTKVTQILTNLISNALKFTHEGYIEFGYNLKDTELEFYVKDTGIGIKPEMQIKIFERFVQAETGLCRRYGGNGLGLSISKGFVELLDGKFWLQSELDKGSNFYFTIPYKPVHEVDKINTTKLNANVTTVLIAEDEEYNYLYIEELLIDMDLKLIHAKDGKEAIEICKANPDINLVLMDIKMPILDGHTATNQIRVFRPDLVIIGQSAYTLEQYIEKYCGNPFNDYITKPINETELKQKLMKYINK